MGAALRSMNLHSKAKILIFKLINEMKFGRVKDQHYGAEYQKNLTQKMTDKIEDELRPTFIEQPTAFNIIHRLNAMMKESDEEIMKMMKGEDGQGPDQEVDFADSDDESMEK